MRPSRLSAARLAVAATVATVLVPLAPASPAVAATPVAPGGVAVVSGTGIGDGGPATQARLDAYRVVYTPGGDLVVVERTRLRRIDKDTGVITTIAGTGIQGFSGDGGPAAQATFGWINDVAFAADGTAYVSDWANNRVRRIAPDGTVSTLVTLTNPVAVTLSPQGVLYVAQTLKVSRWTGTALQLVAGGGTNNADTVPDARHARLNQTNDIAFTPNGHLLLAEIFAGRVRRVAGGVPGAALTTVAGAGAAPLTSPHSLAARPDGSVAITTHGAIRLLANAGGATPGPLTTVLTAWDYHSVASDAAGALVAVRHEGRNAVVVRSVPSQDLVAGSEAAADGSLAANGWWNELRDAAAGPDGTVYVVDENVVRTIDGAGVLGTLAGTNGWGPSSGDGGPATAAVFADLGQVAPAPDGSVYVSDGSRVRRIVPGGTVTAVGTDLGAIVTGLAVDADNAVYAVTACSTFRIPPGGTVETVNAPSCGLKPASNWVPSHPAWLPDVVVDAAGRPVVTRFTSATTTTTVYRTEAGGTVTKVDTGPYGTGVAVRPDGSLETALTALRPDGAWVRRSYRYAGVEQWRMRLAAEPGGTLLALHEKTLLRLTPADQAVPPTVTGLAVVPGPGSLTLSWDAGTSDELTGYTVRVVRGSTPSLSPRIGDGDAVTLPAGATGVTLTRAGLVGGYPGLRSEEYAVAVFATGPAGAAAPATATATPLPENTPPGTGSGLALDVEDGLLTATWTKPGDDDLYRAVARLAPTTPPATADAGTPAAQVSLGTASWSVASLTQGTYGVSVFHEDVYGNRSLALSGTVFVDKTPPAAATGLTATSILDATRVRATWTAPGADVKYVRARLLTGYSYPATPSDGIEPVASSRSSAEWPVNHYGAHHRIAVFTTDRAGNTSRATYLYIPRRPVRLQIAAPAAVKYESQVTIRGSITSSVTGSGYADQRVELWARPRFGTAPFRFVSAVHSNQYGRVLYQHTPSVEMQYQLRHAPSTVAGATSPTAVVGVVPEVLSNPKPWRGVPRGGTFTMYAGLDPAHSGVALTVQRYSAGAWHDVVTGYTARDGLATIVVRVPRTAGTHWHRVVFRGDRDHRPSVGFHHDIRVV